MCVTSFQGRQILMCVTLWYGRLSAMTEEKEDPAGLRGLEAMAGAAKHARSALMLPRSRHIRTALKCVTLWIGRQSFMCVTLWIGRLSAMTEEKEEPAGLRGLEATARGTSRSKGRAHLCSLAVRAEPHLQGRPGALTYTMTGALRDRKAAHICAFLPCGRSRSGKADQVRSRIQWRGALRDQRDAHYCAVLPVRAEPHRQGRPGALTYAMAGAAERTRSALMLPRSRHIRTALMCVTLWIGRQSLMCVTLWIGRQSLM